VILVISTKFFETFFLINFNISLIYIFKSDIMLINHPNRLKSVKSEANTRSHLHSHLQNVNKLQGTNALHLGLVKKSEPIINIKDFNK
jgi:hypothetical protein